MLARNDTTYPPQTLYVLRWILLHEPERNKPLHKKSLTDIYLCDYISTMIKAIVNTLNITAVTLLAGVALLFTNLSAQAAQIPETYTNANFWTSEHDRPVSFEKDKAGNFSGKTVTGKIFTQKNIVTNTNIRLQRFAIDEAFFYISDRGIIIADNNAKALSVYLNRNT